MPPTFSAPLIVENTLSDPFSLHFRFPPEVFFLWSEVFGIQDSSDPKTETLRHLVPSASNLPESSNPSWAGFCLTCSIPSDNTGIFCNQAAFSPRNIPPPVPPTSFFFLAVDLFNTKSFTNYGPPPLPPWRRLSFPESQTLVFPWE